MVRLLMKLTDWLFAGPKAAEKVLDGTIAGIDKLVFTEEEKNDARKEALAMWLKLQEMMGEETSVRGMTRRILAVMVVGVYIVLSLLSVAVWPWMKDWADFIWEVANAGQYGWMTLTVVVFYFGPYVIERMFAKKTA
jgi:hypothetical protein